MKESNPVGVVSAREGTPRKYRCDYINHLWDTSGFKCLRCGYEKK